MTLNQNRNHDALQAVAEQMAAAESILFITGAGISADSGLPTYRGVGGLYEIDQTDEGIPIESILSRSMLRSKPDLTWKYLSQIAEATRPAQPNEAHHVIAMLENSMPRVCTLTQNIDGLHLRAGSRNLIEIHGHLRTTSCLDCGTRREVNDRSLQDVRKCESCGGQTRPDVVLFEEALPEPEILRLVAELEQGFDMVFSIGTTAVFPYIQQPIQQARALGRPTVEINPARTILSDEVDYQIPLGAAEALTELAELLNKHRTN